MALSTVVGLWDFVMDRERVLLNAAVSVSDAVCPDGVEVPVVRVPVLVRVAVVEPVWDSDADSVGTQLFVRDQDLDAEGDSVGVSVPDMEPVVECVRDAANDGDAVGVGEGEALAVGVGLEHVTEAESGDRVASSDCVGVRDAVWGSVGVLVCVQDPESLIVQEHDRDEVTEADAVARADPEAEGVGDAETVAWRLPECVAVPENVGVRNQERLCVGDKDRDGVRDPERVLVADATGDRVAVPEAESEPVPVGVPDCVTELTDSDTTVGLSEREADSVRPGVTLCVPVAEPELLTETDGDLVRLSVRWAVVEGVRVSLTRRELDGVWVGE